MSDHFLYLIERDHFCFDMKGIFILTIIDSCSAFCEDQNRIFSLQKGHRLSDHSRLYTECFCCHRNRCCGFLKFDHMIQKSLLFQICFCFFK